MTYNANCVGNVVQIGVHRTACQSLLTISHARVYSTAPDGKTIPTIVSVKGIPALYASNLLCGLEQPSVPPKHVQIELGGCDDDVKYDRYE